MPRAVVQHFVSTASASISEAALHQPTQSRAAKSDRSTAAVVAGEKALPTLSRRWATLARSTMSLVAAIRMPERMTRTLHSLVST